MHVAEIKESFRSDPEWRQAIKGAPDFGGRFGCANPPAIAAHSLVLRATEDDALRVRICGFRRRDELSEARIIGVATTVK